MGKVTDMAGQRFGKLLVVKEVGLNNSNAMVWECLCDCGIMVNKVGKALRKAKELYCGDMHPTKVCTKCKVEKYKSTGFHKCDSPMGIQPVCKECKSIFYSENKDLIANQYHEKRKDIHYKEIMRQKNYRSWTKNKHKDLPYKRVYNKRPEVIERRKEIHKDRKENDPNYNIKRRLRWRVRDAIKRVNGNGYKYKSSLVLLGCDMDFFKSYLESKFEYGMNWERFAYIHIDHIKPCSQFDLTKLEDQKACFHYSNLQPLWELDNLVKSWKYAS